MRFLHRVIARSRLRYNERAQELRRSLLLSVIALAAACQYLPIQAMGQGANQPVPDVTFRTYENETIRTSDLKGEVVFVGLWMTDSKDCTAMREAFERLDKQFAVQGVWFLAVNEDEKQQAWRDYLFHHPSPMTEVWDENHSFRRKTRLPPPTTILVVDRSGLIRWRSRWTASAEAKASAQLTSLMQEQRPK